MARNFPSRILHPNLSEKIHQLIRQSILEQKFSFGDRIIADELAREFGVSKTPVREALRQLKQEGLIDYIPRRGAFIKSPSQKEIFENLLLREVLEGLAARLAAENLKGEDRGFVGRLRTLFVPFKKGPIEAKRYIRAESRFHDLIAEASRCSRLIESLKNLEEFIFWIRKVILPYRLSESLRDHLAIIDAIEQGDGHLAESLMRAHLRKIRESEVLNQTLQSMRRDLSME